MAQEEFFSSFTYVKVPIYQINNKEKSCFKSCLKESFGMLVRTLFSLLNIISTLRSICEFMEEFMEQHQDLWVPLWGLTNENYTN